jgi:uncharacterized membrane protein (UPF0136 family)
MMKRNALLTTTAVALVLATPNPVHATHVDEDLYFIDFGGRMTNAGSSGNYNCFMPGTVEVWGRFTYDRNKPTFVETSGVGAGGRTMYDIDAQILTSESWLYEGSPPALLVGEAYLVVDNDLQIGDGEWIDRMHFVVRRTHPINELEIFIMLAAEVVFTNRTNTPSDDALEVCFRLQAPKICGRLRKRRSLSRFIRSKIDRSIWAVACFLVKCGASSGISIAIMVTAAVVTVAMAVVTVAVAVVTTAVFFLPPVLASQSLWTFLYV